MKTALGQHAHSLRTRVAMGVALPLLLTLSGISLLHNWRERRLMEAQIQVTAAQLGRVITGSLRHAMLAGDQAMLATALEDVGAMAGIERVEILNLGGEVKVDSAGPAVGQVWSQRDPGCTECHQYPPEARPRTVLLSRGADVLRIAAPIANEPACHNCHPAELAHLGMLLADLPMLPLERHLAQDLRMTLAISGAATLLVTAGVYLLVHRLVVRRVEAFRRPLAQFATGDLAPRLPARASAEDEIDALAVTFNRMADQLEQHMRDEKERGELRHRAIVEERERIARELHDGLAQVLGYLGTKVTAVRLLLDNRQLQAAADQLHQLEAAAGELFVDVREAILGLKLTGRRDACLSDLLADYAAQFSRLSDLPVEVVIAPGAEKINLPAESEVQLLRIVQEALANVRKHARASAAQVYVQGGENQLQLTVSDDGAGFEPLGARHNGWPHFGLTTMRERAEAIGAEFSLDTRPGAGTRITVRLAVNGW